MDQFTASVSELLNAALVAFAAFLNFLLHIFDFFIILINAILSAMHLQ